MPKKNLWLCADYRIIRHQKKPKVLPELHPERADKFHFYALGAGLYFHDEHIIMHEGKPWYIAYRWATLAGDVQAYITLRCEYDGNLKYPYMRIVGLSRSQWLLAKLLLDSSHEAIGQNDPSEIYLGGIMHSEESGLFAECDLAQPAVHPSMRAYAHE